MARIAWHRKKRWWALIAAPIALVLIVAFGFDPIVDRLVRRQLGKVKGYAITIERAQLQPLRLDLAMVGFKATKTSAGGSKEPLLYARKIEIGLHWRELLHRNVVARIDLETPKVNLIAAKDQRETQAEELPDLARQLNDLMPMRIDRVQVRHGELTFIDKTKHEVPRVWLHEIEATVENLSTRAALARGEPTKLALASKVQRKGDLSAYLTADPLAKGLWFSGQVRASGLDVREFHDLIASRSGLALDQGTLDVFAEFDARGDRITGGVRPILKNAKVVQAREGIENWFKKGLADAALNLFSDRVAGRHAVATTIPIEGKLTSPDLQLWPTIFGVVRNAFVEGVSESYERLPPPKAEERESLIEQAADALNKGKRAPKAQPEEKP